MPVPEDFLEAGQRVPVLGSLRNGLIGDEGEAWGGVGQGGGQGGEIGGGTREQCGQQDLPVTKGGGEAGGGWAREAGKGGGDGGSRGVDKMWRP